MPKLLINVCLLVFSLSWPNLLLGQLSENDPAPHLRVTKWLNTPPVDWSGKLLFVSFCPDELEDCSYLIHHVDSLSNKIQGDIVFLSFVSTLSTSSDSLFQTPLVADSTGQTFRHYRVGSQAVSYLISPTDTVLWTGRSTAFKPETVTQLLPAYQNDLFEHSVADALKEPVKKLSLQITEGVHGAPRYRMDQSALLIRDSLSSVIRYCLDTDIYTSQIDLTDNPMIEVSYQRMDIDNKKMKAEIVDKLKVLYDFTVRQGTVLKPVLILQPVDTTLLWDNSVIEYEGTIANWTIKDNGDWEGNNQPVGFVINALRRIHKTLVIDKTEIKGSYDWLIKNTTADHTNEYLEEIGLRLVKEEHPVTKTYVEPSFGVADR